MGVKKLGVHGESIGGLVATHLAKTKNLDFLCADRTFTSLSKVGEHTFGKIAGLAFRFITLWNDHITLDYIDTSCYKVITFDPRDEVIHMLGSLKYGATRYIIEKRLGHINDLRPPVSKGYYSLVSPHKLLYGIKSFIFWMRREIYEWRVESSMKNYYLLNRAQTLSLYWAFNRITKLMPELSSVMNFTNLRRQVNTLYDAETRGQDDFSKVGVSRGPKLLAKPLATSTAGDTGDIELSSPTKVYDESIALNNPVNIDIEVKGNYLTDDTMLLKSVAKPRYDYLLDENTKSSNDVISFLVKVFSAFEVLEAGGIYLTDVMSLEDKSQLDAFKVIHSI